MGTGDGFKLSRLVYIAKEVIARAQKLLDEGETVTIDPYLFRIEYSIGQHGAEAVARYAKLSLMNSRECTVKYIRGKGWAISPILIKNKVDVQSAKEELEQLPVSELENEKHVITKCPYCHSEFGSEHAFTTHLAMYSQCNRKHAEAAAPAEHDQTPPNPSKCEDLASPGSELAAAEAEGRPTK